MAVDLAQQLRRAEAILLLALPRMPHEVYCDVATSESFGRRRIVVRLLSRWECVVWDATHLKGHVEDVADRLVDAAAHLIKSRGKP